MATPRIPKPRLACEITSQNVIAARGKGDATGLEVHSVRRLDPDVVRPSLSVGNVGNASGLSQSIGSALAAVGGRKRDVAAILPDAAVRVLLMDFDLLPEKAAEAEPIIRFRLRKSVPFDADQAALSFQTYRKQGVVKVLAAVTPREVLNEYESAFRSAGYEPGYVLPSTLAALNAVEATRPTLLVKSDGNFISVAIADADEVYPSIVFFEDNYSAKIERILLASISDAEELKQALQEQTGVRPGTFTPGVHTGDSLSGDVLPAAALAGVAGVLTH